MSTSTSGEAQTAQITATSTTAGRVRPGRRPPLAILFTAVLLFLVFAGPWLAPHDPFAVDLPNALASPSLAHPAGTDQLGRDVLSRILRGGVTTVGVALTALIAAMLIGVPIGMYTAHIGPRADWGAQRLGDVFLVLPEYLVAIVVTGLLGSGFINLLLAVAVVKWVGYARLARSVVLRQQSRDYVMAARVNGAGVNRIVLRHFVPHVAGPILALATLDLGKIVLLVASLSFLGFGVPQPSPEWGAMLNEGRTYFAETSMLMLAPGLAILLVVLATSLAGDRLARRLGGDLDTPAKETTP